MNIKTRPKSLFLEIIEGAWLYPCSRYRAGHEPVGSGYNRLSEATKKVLRELKSEDLANVRVDTFLR
jgi:hypothetical protein